MPFDLYHRDDQPDDVRAAHEGRGAVVLAATDDAYVVLLAPEELATCAGSVDRFSAALDAAIAAAGLSLPA